MEANTCRMYCECKLWLAIDDLRGEKYANQKAKIFVKL